MARISRLYLAPACPPAAAGRDPEAVQIRPTKWFMAAAEDDAVSTEFGLVGTLTRTGRLPCASSRTAHPGSRADRALPLLTGSVTGPPVPPIRSAPAIARPPSLCPYARR